MSKQIQEAYIVAATRLPVGKRNGVYAVCLLYTSRCV